MVLLNGSNGKLLVEFRKTMAEKDLEKKNSYDFCRVNTRSNNF